MRCLGLGSCHNLCVWGGIPRIGWDAAVRSKCSGPRCSRMCSPCPVCLWSELPGGTAHSWAQRGERPEETAASAWVLPTAPRSLGSARRLVSCQSCPPHLLREHLVSPKLVGPWVVFAAGLPPLLRDYAVCLSWRKNITCGGGHMARCGSSYLHGQVSSAHDSYSF